MASALQTGQRALRVKKGEWTRQSKRIKRGPVTDQVVAPPGYDRLRLIDPQYFAEARVR